MQLSPPSLRASEVRNMKELAHYNIIVILTNCVHLLAYTSVTTLPFLHSSVISRF
jgi:hypothetical protein